MAVTITATKEKAGFRVWLFNLLGAGVEDTTIGSWIYVGDQDALSLHISGVTVGTLQLYGSNTKAKPTDVTDHYQLGGDITANAIVEIATPILWIKLKVTIATTGTFLGNLLGQERRHG